MAKQKFRARVKHRRSFNMRRWIQDHKKSVFVSLTVICMGAFVVGPSLQTFMDQPGISGGTRMVVWKGGSLTQAQLQAMQSAESQTKSFLRTLAEKTRNKNGNPTDRFGLAGNFARSNLRQLLNKRLLADQASELGIVVSDEMIRDYLGTLTDGILTNAEVVAAMDEAVRAGFSERQLFEQLRMEILSFQMRTMVAISGIPNDPMPGDAWSYHNQLNRRVTAEMLPIPVSEFRSEVGVPNGTQEREFYEQYKDFQRQEGVVGYTTPGKISFQFVMGDLEKFQAEEIERIKPEVTDEEIEEYYTTNISLYKKPKPLDDIEEPEDKPDETPEDKPDETPEDKPDETPEDKPDETPEDKPDETPEDKPEETPEEGCQPEDKPDETPEDKPDETPEDKPEETPEDKPEDEEGPEEEPKDEYYTLEEKQEEIRETVARNKAAEPARKKMLAAINAVEDVMVEFEVEFDADTEQSDTTVPAQGAPDLAEAVADFPLLTTGETGEISFSELQRAQQSSPQDDEPGWYELARTTTFDFSNQQFRQIPVFLQLAFSSQNRYESESFTLPSPQFANQVFLFWRTTVRLPRQRDFTEAKPDVIDDWVTMEAAKLLEKESTRLSEEASKDGAASLADSLKDKEHCQVDQVFETHPFTFRSSGMTPLGGNSGGLGAISSTDDVPVEDITPDCMQKIFELNPGGVTAVMDGPRQTAYVVRMIADISGEDLRREGFAIGSQQGLSPQLTELGQQARIASFNDWIIQFLKDLEVEWQVNPDAN